MQLKDVTPIIKAILEERNKIPLLINTERYIPNWQPNHNGNAMRGGIRKALRIIEQAPVVDAMPRWISVEERLPETRDWVLVIGEFVPEGGWFVPHIAEYFLDSWRLDVDECSSPEERSIKITHWMPLPEPPKEE